MSRRRQGRELALGCLYAHFSTGEPVETVFEGQSRRMTTDAETASYAHRLFASAVEHGEEIDRLIRESSVNWDFARIGQIEKNILRLAIAELKFCLETPAAVAINEALELARDYAAEESRSFINAVLDRVYKGGNAAASNGVKEADSESAEGPPGIRNPQLPNEG